MIKYTVESKRLQNRESVTDDDVDGQTRGRTLEADKEHDEKSLGGTLRIPWR